MALQNDAQNKKFGGDGSASINNAQTSERFSFTRNRARKIIPEHEHFSTTQFYLRPNRAGRTAHEASYRKHCKFQG